MDHKRPAGDGTPESDRDFLRRLAWRRLGPRHNGPIDPSDVAHQAFLRAHRRRKQFLGKTEAKWRAWLRRILERVLADAFRNRHVQREGHPDPGRPVELPSDVPANSHSTPSQQAQREEQRRRLHAALAQLGEDERMALELRFFRDPRCSLEEIARLLNRPSAKAVSGLLYRGQEKLRQLLCEEG